MYSINVNISYIFIMLKFSISASLESTWKTSFHTPSFCHFLNLAIYNIPFSMIRLFFAGRPLFPVRSAGSLSFILSHSLLLISYCSILLLYHFCALCASFIFQTMANSFYIFVWLFFMWFTCKIYWWNFNPTIILNRKLFIWWVSSVLFINN